MRLYEDDEFRQAKLRIAPVCHPSNPVDTQCSQALFQLFFGWQAYRHLSKYNRLYCMHRVQSTGQSATRRMRIRIS